MPLRSVRGRGRGTRSLDRPRRRRRVTAMKRLDPLSYTRARATARPPEGSKGTSRAKVARRAHRRPAGKGVRGATSRAVSEGPAHPGLLPAIVGLGSSAGGLDALTRFFSAMPSDSGMAFVIVAHLDPTHG